MGIVNGIGIVNNLLAGDMSGAQLQTYLGTGSNLASFVQVVNIRSQLQVVLNTPAAVSAVLASGTAGAAIVANDQALRVWVLYGSSFSHRSFANMTAVLASAPAMAGVAASSAAMSLIVTSAALRAAVVASAPALAAVNASDQAVRIWMLNGTDQNYINFANVAAVAASSTAMAAIAASSAAMEAVVASSAAMAAVAASTTGVNAVVAAPAALAAVVASSLAMTALAAAPAAKMAIFNSDTALNAIKASATAMAALRGAAQYSIPTHVGTGGGAAIPGLNAAGSYIVLGYSKGTTTSGSIGLISTRRSGSAQPAGFAAYGAPSSVTAQQENIALPLVSPFNAISSSGIQWYFGMLRCDV